MKQLLLVIVFVSGTYLVNAQEQTSALLQETARTLVQKGDFDNAVIMLERAWQQDPDNVDMLRDYCYALFLKRDFSKAIEIGKEMIEKPKADPQSFQILGMAYKAVASYKECSKIYRTALRKFPNSGVIYNEYAELFALENELEEAILQWEKGIQADPVYSSNYYNATMYYVRTKNWLRASLYGEIFLNLESYSARTKEIKEQLYVSYQNLLTNAASKTVQSSKNLTPFEKSMQDVYLKITSNKPVTIGFDEITGFRTRFLVEWLQGKQKDFPFQLFDHQQYLVSQGIFEAYQYWLFSENIGEAAYQDWQKTHQKDFEAFLAFQQSRVFKLPAGQYYF